MLIDESDPFNLIRYQEAMDMLDPKLDLTSVMIVIATCMCAVAVAAALAIIHDDRPEIPDNVLEGIILDIICEQNIAALSGNRRYSTNKDGSRKEPH
jgi:hypothetical protein